MISNTRNIISYKRGAQFRMRKKGDGRRGSAGAASGWWCWLIKALLFHQSKTRSRLYLGRAAFLGGEGS